ncbi:MAG: hypothetical protein M1812_007073 [Candelaria pacifica]|nr:MAG: hypothetical protein M1812_007073 [Candelaria pacifica]
MECSRVADYLEAIIKKCAKDGLVGGYIPVLAKEYDSRKDFRVKADSGGLEVFVTSDFYCDRNTTGLDSTDRCIFVY